LSQFGAGVSSARSSQRDENGLEYSTIRNTTQKAILIAEFYFERQVSREFPAVRRIGRRVSDGSVYIEEFDIKAGSNSFALA
jgi:hypothetical protein